MVRGIFISIFILGLLSLPVWGQDEPLASPRAFVEQVVGTHPISIHYFSPGVKDRVVWGELVPYGKIWRAGANDKTVIEFRETVNIGGTTLEAGRYGFQIFPEKDEWGLVFSSTTDDNAQEHDPANDVARLKIKPVEAPFRERLAYSFDNMTDASCTISLHWEKLIGHFEVRLGAGRPSFSGDALEVFDVVETSLKFVQAHDVTSMLKTFAEDYTSDQGGGRDDYRDFLNGAIEQGILNDMKVDLSGTTIELDGDEAVVEGIKISGAFGDLSMEFELAKRDGKWLIIYSAQY